MGRYALDTSLSDLDTITAKVNRTVSQASRQNPSIVTLTIESGLLQQILTAASLHMSDNKFVPKPEVGDMAELIAANNQEGQDWHWLMADAIDVISARASKAAHPNSGKIDHEQVVSNRRKHRAIDEQWAKEDREKAVAIDPNTPEGATARWDALGTKGLSAAAISDLMTTLMAEAKPVQHDVAVRLVENYRVENAKATKAEARLAAVVKAAQGI